MEFLWKFASWENFWHYWRDFHVGRSVGRGRDAISDNGLLAWQGLMPSLLHGRITLFRRQQDSPCWIVGRFYEGALSRTKTARSKERATVFHSHGRADLWFARQALADRIFEGAT